MAYNKYDRRLESLVVETRTLWGDDVGEELDADDRAWVAAELHRNPQLAGKIQYERAHTGFTRIITVTEEDIPRLYETHVGEAGHAEQAG